MLCTRNYLVQSKFAKLSEGHVDATPHPVPKTHDEAYYCVFDLEPRENFIEYEGFQKCAFNQVVVDFDSEELSESLRELQKVVEHLGLSSSEYAVFFSGKKGFHLYIPAQVFGLRDVEHVSLARGLKNYFTKLIIDLDLETLDLSLYTPARKLRAFNSKHQETGLYKIQVPHHLPLQEILEQAKTPKNSVVFGEFHRAPIAHVPLPDPETQDQKRVRSLTESAREMLENAGILEEAEELTLPVSVTKLCILKFLRVSVSVGERHIAFRALLQELVSCNRPEHEIREAVHKFCKINNIEERIKQYDKEATIALSGKEYDHGCYGGIKYSHCNPACHVYKKLDATKRRNFPEDSGVFEESNTRVIEREEPKEVVVEITQEVCNEEESEEQTTEVSLLDVTSVSGDLQDAKKAPSHNTLVQTFLAEYKGQYLKQDKDVFIWDKTHWREATTYDLDRVKKVLHKRLGFVQAKKVEECYKLLLLYIPSVPNGVDMYQSNPSAINFKNGTLWLNRSGGKYTLTFKAHKKSDYITHCLDLDYSEEGEDNVELMGFLDRVFEGDKEKDQKIRILKQVAGAMLVPVFPQVFFLLGRAGSGKSTFTKVFYHLIGGPRTCGGLEPKQLHGFLLESLINKTVNVHTDADEQTTIPDSVIKSLTDRIPQMVNRKGRKVVQAYLPAVHVWCANNMPPTQVKDQHVYDRRMTIVKFDKAFNKDDMILNYEEIILNAGTGGLLKFAIEGIKDLVASGGTFYKSEGSAEIVNKWQDRAGDSLQDFLKAIELNEVLDIEVSAGDLTNRADFFRVYEKWCEEEGHKFTPMSRSVMYKELEVRGVQLYRNKLGRYVRGYKYTGGPEPY